MTRSTRRRLGGVAALILVIAVNGCAARPTRGGFNCDRRWGGGTIGGALTGAMIGGGVGGGIVATSGETERQAEDYATAIGIGVISRRAHRRLLRPLRLRSAVRGAAASAPGPAPPPPPTGQEEDRAPRGELRLRQVEHPSRRRRHPRRSGAHPARGARRSTSPSTATPTRAAPTSTTSGCRSAARWRSSEYLVRLGIARQPPPAAGLRRVAPGREQRDRRRPRAEPPRRAEHHPLRRRTGRSARADRPVAPFQSPADAQPRLVAEAVPVRHLLRGPPYAHARTSRAAVPSGSTPRSRSAPGSRRAARTSSW